MTTESLRRLISTLQKSVATKSLSDKEVGSAIASLEQIGYCYDADRFPKLVGTEHFSSMVADTPQSLAEALLWTLGKWESYKKFVSQFADANS